MQVSATKAVKRVKEALIQRCMKEGGKLPYKTDDSAWDDLAETAVLAALGEYDFD